MKTIAYVDLMLIIIRILDPTQPDSEHGAEGFVMAWGKPEGPLDPSAQVIYVYQMVKGDSNVLRVEAIFEGGSAYMDFFQADLPATGYRINPVVGGKSDDTSNLPPWISTASATVFFQPSMAALLEFAGVQSFEELTEG